jgi:iron(III) transport system ATP-binding protein
VTATPALEVDDVACCIGGRLVVDGAGFSIPTGGLAALLGPSGCGKTTLLRAIAGFEPVTRGRIAIGGSTASDAHTQVPPERRAVGLVFQDLALFPHLDVAGNVSFGLHRLPAAERRREVDVWLTRLRIEELRARMPHELSGGQQQRVAIARALAAKPSLLLLDEPFSSLDARLRTELADEIAGTLRELGIAALLVTHDHEEAFAFADRIGVMHGGRIVQWGSAADLYHRPIDSFVASFVGEGVLLPARCAPDGVHTPLGTLPCPAGSSHGPGRLLVRPDDIVLAPGAATTARVRKIDFRGATVLAHLTLTDGSTAQASWPSHAAPPAGSEVGVALDMRHVVLLN